MVPAKDGDYKAHLFYNKIYLNHMTFLYVKLTYHLKDFHVPGNLDHHKQLLQAPMQVCHQKCSRHHLDPEISEHVRSMFFSKKNKLKRVQPKYEQSIQNKL